MNLEVQHTWNGIPLAPHQHTSLHLTVEGDMLRVDVDAPYHGDPSPPQAPGPTDQLWDYEVIELFLVGDDLRYLEIELGPHGHHLVLQLHGIRQRASPPLPLDFTARIERDQHRWKGQASIPFAYLPAGLHAANAFAIHGQKPFRRHDAAFPVPGSTPDFHQPDAFAPFRLSLP